MINKEEIEAIDILNNIIADEVIGTYCIEIQKTVDCSKNCENEDCYLMQAIDKINNLIKKQENRIKELEEIEKEHQKLNKELQVRITELEEKNDILDNNLEIAYGEIQRIGNTLKLGEHCITDDMIDEIKKLQNLVKGKSIQELGTSDIYKEGKQ